MKMRLQLASVLPAPKAEPPGWEGKGVFSATLQGMMGMPDATKTQFGRIAAQPSKLAQLQTNVGAGKPRGSIEELAGQVHPIPKEAQTGSPSFGGFHADPADQREQTVGAIVPKPGTEESAVLTGPVVQAPTVEEANAQSSIVKMSQVMPGKTDLIRQPSAGAKPCLSGSTKNVSPHLAHKAEAMNDQLHDAAAQSSSMTAPALPLSDFVVPVIAAQLNGSQPAPSLSAANVVSNRGRGQGQSARVSVQSVITSPATAADKASAALGSQALAHAGARLGAEDGQPLRQPMSVIRLAGSQPAAPSGKKNSATIATPGTPPFQPKAAHSVAESGEGAASQVDSRLPKDAEGKRGTEPKPEIKVSVSAQSISGTAAVEHQAAPNLSPANFHVTEKGIATHRPETNAAQMLQKMDMAVSPGVVQLRADARRLDVGVSSATLGWVEVRATTGPSGRIDATLETQNDASAHVLAGQSSEISSYAREHSVQLGHVSVGVGTGDSMQGESRSTHQGSQDENATPTRGVVRSQASAEQVHHAADAVSLINVRV